MMAKKRKTADATARHTENKTKAKRTKAPKKNGRPSDFSDRLVMRILELAKAGKTDAQIAADIGISASTLNNWKGSHPDFFTALKDAKAVADDLVVASLFQRAVGYRHSAVKFFYDPKTAKVVSQPYIENHAPDTTACIFWLKNRQPDLWRDKRETELTGKDGGPIKTQPASAAEIIEQALKELQDAGWTPPSESFG